MASLAQRSGICREKEAVFPTMDDCCALSAWGSDLELTRKKDDVSGDRK